MASICTAAWLLLGNVAGADVFLTEATNISVDVASDGRLATDILGDIWLLPNGGGEAKAIEAGDRPARRPRWSPDDTKLVYESNSVNGIGLHDLDSGTTRRLGASRFVDGHPDWHPDGERIVFSSDRRESGLDIWEIDIQTGLTFRLTSLPGDETEPAWSADGRNLVYVHELEGTWSLMLRRRGQRDETLMQSPSPLRAPAWRPDGSLVTHLQHSDDGWQVWMSVLSEPRLHRVLIDQEDFFLAPITWLDRQRMIYAANGKLRLRRFNSWSSSNITFRARVSPSHDFDQAKVENRKLAFTEEPSGTTVIRAGRLFDGVAVTYVVEHDIVIEGGRIAAIEQRRDRAGDGSIVIELGDVTVLPGYIDAYARLPRALDVADGPLLLSFGVTTLVASHPRLEELNQLWNEREVPGPRLLAAASLDDADASQRSNLSTSVLTASDGRAASPGGHRYQDLRLTGGAGTTPFVSGLADSETPGIIDIWKSRQAKLFGPEPTLTRRFTTRPMLDHAANTMVLGSYANGLAAGPALHAEFRALAAAGLSEAQTLKSAGVNAALSLGFGLQLGRIAPGAAADLVVVDGDPLSDIDDALNVIGIVRNGRFFSLSGLIDRSLAAQSVE